MIKIILNFIVDYFKAGVVCLRISHLAYALIFTTFIASASSDASYNYFDNDDFYVRNIDLAAEFVDFELSKTLNWIDTNIPFCFDIMTNLTDCIPNICKENHDGILHIKQVNGYKGDYCELEEKFMYQGSLLCLYKPEENIEVLQIIDRISNSGESKVAKEQLQKVQKFYQSNCKMTAENRYTNALFIAQDSYDYELNNTLALFINEPVINQDKILVPKLLDTEGKNDENRSFWFNNSVSYSDSEYKILDQVAQRFRNTSGKADLAQIAKDVLQSVTREIKITSLIFFTPSKWSVWINRTKFSSQDNNKKLQIKRIDSAKAKISWTVKNIDQISTKWRENYRRITDNKFVSKDGRVVMVVSGSEDYNLEFELRLGEILKLSTLLIEKESIK